MGENIQFLEIIFFAMVAIFIILRLRSVLGRRTGNERPAQRTFVNNRDDTRRADGSNVVQLPDRNGANDSDATLDTESGIASGTSSIQEADPSFTVSSFVSGANTAYEMILHSFASGDTETLRSLLDDDVYEEFQLAIDSREERHETLETTLVSIKETEIIEAQLQNQLAEVTLRYRSQVVNVVRSLDGTEVSGDPHVIQELTDYWTFARDVQSANPNWKLTATRNEK